VYCQEGCRRITPRTHVGLDHTEACEILRDSLYTVTMYLLDYAEREYEHCQSYDHAHQTRYIGSQSHVQFTSS